MSEMCRSMVLYSLECQLFAVETQLGLLDQGAWRDVAERARQFVTRSVVHAQTMASEARKSGEVDTGPFRQWIDAASRASLSGLDTLMKLPAGKLAEENLYRQWLEAYAAVLRDAVLRGGASSRPASTDAPRTAA